MLAARSLRAFSSTAATPAPVLRVAIAGSGIAGSILAASLLREPRVEVRVFEKRKMDALPPGLNLLLNHNGMSALRALDPALEANVRGRGHDIIGWSARTMTGKVLYEIPDATAAGLANGNGVRARWDEVNAAVQSAAWDAIEWGDAITSYRYTSDADGRVSVAAVFGDGGRPDVAADLLVGADGRYSAVRRHLEGGELPPPIFGPPAISDFRVVVREADALPELRGVIEDMLRVYNAPDASLLAAGGEYAHLADDHGFASSCMAGLARVGIMRIRPPPPDGKTVSSSDTGHVGIWGNFPLPPGGVPIPPAAKTRDGLAALFTPAEGVDSLDPIGRLVYETLTRHSDGLHWTRKQETPQRVSDGNGHVLLLGDAAGAIFPSLGQGANLAIEDACTAAVTLRTFVRAAIEAGAPCVDVPAATAAIERLRLQRRTSVQALSREHAQHVYAAEGGEASLAAETADWTGDPGGRFPTGVWRRRLRGLWCGWPKPDATEAAVSEDAKRTAATVAAAAHAYAYASAGGDEVTADARATPPLVAETADRSNFALFGQVCQPEADGLPYGPLDAQLEGLDNGTPRLYLMRLDGPRPLRFDRLTHHKAISQCLGALGTSRSEGDFYLAVHAPTAEAEPPTLANTRAFRVAPGTFVKLHPGTWHAGPLWVGADPSRAFYNFELSDTNVVDHHTVRVSESLVPIAAVPVNEE